MFGSVWKYKLWAHNSAECRGFIESSTATRDITSLYDMDNSHLNYKLVCEIELDSLNILECQSLSLTLLGIYVWCGGVES